MTREQESTLKWFLEAFFYTDPSDYEMAFHHGDCIGADIQAAVLAREIGYYIIGHPPSNPKLRGYFSSDREMPPLPYMDRNAKIVQSTEILFACTKGEEEQRSGTWSTIRLSRAIHRARIIIYPSGQWRVDA